MVHVLPRWLDMTMEVDIDGEVLVMVVEATAAEVMEVPEAMLVVEAMVAAATLVAPTPIAEAMAEATEEVSVVATEVAREETIEGLVEEATEELGDSSEGLSEGAMGVVTLDKEEEVVAIKTCYVSAYA